MIMNQWGNESYLIPHMMQANHMGPPALLPTPMPAVPPGHGNMVQPLAPPEFLMGEWAQASIEGGPGGPISGFIGPVVPEKTDVDLTNEEEGRSEQRKSSRESRDPRDRRDAGDRDRDRGRRPRSPFNRNNRDRNDSRSERSRSDRRERRGPQRWSDAKDNVQAPVVMANNMMMPGTNMMQYSNMMGQQQMEMSNMQNMQNMASMMSNMMPNMMSNMMDQNMMMMQQMPMNINNTNQPIFVANGVLLPPIPNTSMPSRRERPPGCRTIFVGGLPQGIGEDVIREIFQRFGLINNVKLHKQGVCHVRFEKQELVETSFLISGFRYKNHDQMDNEATTIFVDYALNREDQSEFERSKRKRTPTPPRIEPYSPAAFTTITDKIKSDNEFSDAAPTLAGWLERGECNKKNANAFYSLIQAANNQIRRLYNEKMSIDEEFQAVKGSLKDKFSQIILQFEQVGKILTAARIQRVSDHFSKQQRRNIEMWLKMTEDVENIKEEYNAMFDEEESEDKGSSGKVAAVTKKYEVLRAEHETLQYELEGYKNEAFLAKDEAERRFEKFKAHFVATQALQNKQVYPPLPPASPKEPPMTGAKPPAPRDENKVLLSSTILPSEAKLISVLTAFLLVHPLGASLDYLVSYVRSIIPSATQATVHNILQKYGDVFTRKITGVGANIESRWTFVTFDVIKQEIV